MVDIIEAVVMPEPSGSGILYQDVKARDWTSHGVKHEGERSIGHHVEIVPRQSIRLFGIETNRYGGPLAYDVTYRIGDTVSYDSYNLTYLGTITGIGKKTVTVEHHGGRRRLDLSEFSWRNRTLDLLEVAERNADTMQHI